MAPRIHSAALALAVMACSGEQDPETLLCDQAADLGSQLQPLESYGYVAHAGGSPGGLLQTEHYTNTREAFDASYHNGFRVYEFDLITLGDGTVVAAHDHHEDLYGLTIEFGEAVRADLEGAFWQEKYPVLFGEDLIELMVEYPDVWIILDTKWDHTLIAQTLVDMAPSDSVRDRMVPHLASDEHTNELYQVYAFPERMLAGYRWRGSDAAFMDRMNRHGIDNIMMWWDARWTEEVQALMDDAGHNVWVHTPAMADVIDDFWSRGIGVYSNGYIPCP